jgi:hypothetical protein
MGNEKALGRIERSIGVEGISDKLAKLALSDLTTLLIETADTIVADKIPVNLLNSYNAKKQFFGPNGISQRELIHFEQLCYDGLPEHFESVQLSPIAPLGTNAVLTSLSQNNTLSTIRGSEVVSDITTQLALECATRDTSSEIVNLASMGRVLRLQPFDSSKGYMQHFNLFNLCSGGKVVGQNINSPMVADHIDSLLGVIGHLNQNGYGMNNITVSITDINFMEQLIQLQGLSRDVLNKHSLDEEFDVFDTYDVDFPKVVDDLESLTPDKFANVGMKDFSKYYAGIYRDIIADLKEVHPGVLFNFDFNRKAGLGYYRNLCFHIFCEDKSGNTIQLADGGSVDWLAKLKNDNKNTMVISGIGAELIQKIFVNQES